MSAVLSASATEFTRFTVKSHQRISQRLHVSKKKTKIRSPRGAKVSKNEVNAIKKALRCYIYQELALTLLNFCAASYFPKLI